MMFEKKILILGGTGFIGQKLARLLNSKGYRVRVFSPSASMILWDNGIESVDGFIENEKILQDQVEWADVIVHAISSTDPKSSLNNPVFDLTSNLTPLVNLLEILKDKKNKSIFFCSSGGAVYGKPKNIPIKEDHPKTPSTSYGLVKSLMEEYILHYNRNYNIPFVIIRPSNLYGPKIKSIGKQGIISTLIYNTLQDRETEIWSNLLNVRDYIFIDDCVDAIFHLINNSSEGIFNIGTSQGYTLKEVIEIVTLQIGIIPKILTTKNLVIDEAKNILDNTNILQTTDWKPKISLEEGIDITIKYIKSNLKINDN